MPPKATTKTKKWGQADEDPLADLINSQLIDITDTTYTNIEQPGQTVPFSASRPH